MDDVWVLTSELEDAYSDALSERIMKAEGSHNDNERKAIRRLWDNESWASIIKKVHTEGSCWYVWWMDGVHAFIKNRRDH